MKYRKKPVVIEAIQWNGLNLEEVKEFAGDSLSYYIYDSAWKRGVAPLKIGMGIQTLEGEMQVSVGDFIIKDIQGEFYPCKPDIFKETYEEVKE